MERNEMIFMCKIILMECLIINDMNINKYTISTKILVALKVVIAVFCYVDVEEGENGFASHGKIVLNY